MLKGRRLVYSCHENMHSLSFLWNLGVGSPDHIQESDISMLYYLSHSHFT